MKLVITSPLSRSINLNDMRARPSMTNILHPQASSAAFKLNWTLTEWNDALMDDLTLKFYEEEQ